MSETVLAPEMNRATRLADGTPGETRLRTERIPQLDGLRGVAILLVILCHYVGNADHVRLGYWPHRFLIAFTVGWSGVDLFFVLSGFLIGGILLDARKAPHFFRAFYMRRVHRILPIYYAWTLLFGVIVLAALWFAPGRYPVAPSDLVQVPVHLFFLQNIWIGMPTFAWIWFVVTWSLAVEEQFYIVMPPLIRFLSIRNLVWVLSATILAAPLFRIMVFRITGNPYSASIPTPGRADALAWGVLLAIAWREVAFQSLLKGAGRHLRVLTVVLLLAVGLLVPSLVRPAKYLTLTIGLSLLAIFFACLLLLVLSQPEGWAARLVSWRPLRWLGTISYCVYILHDTFNQLAHRILLHTTPELYDASGVALTLLALVVTLAVATLSWRFFEKPLIQRGHSYSYWEARP